MRALIGWQNTARELVVAVGARHARVVSVLAAEHHIVDREIVRRHESRNVEARRDGVDAVLRAHVQIVLEAHRRHDADDVARGFFIPKIGM
jgi:hypothetical protein